MSNLNKLNDVLFDTLDKVQNGEMDEKRASAVVQLSNSIINNGKLQLAAYKFANSGKAPDMFGIPEGNKHVTKLAEKKEDLSSDEKKVLDSRDKHASMLRFAQENDFKNTAEGIGEMGKTEFMAAYAEWLKQ